MSVVSASSTTCPSLMGCAPVGSTGGSVDECATSSLKPSSVSVSEYQSKTVVEYFAVRGSTPSILSAADGEVSVIATKKPPAVWRMVSGTPLMHEAGAMPSPFINDAFGSDGGAGGAGGAGGTAVHVVYRRSNPTS